MNDPEIRSLLRPMLTGGVLIEELMCGNTRADVVHIHPDYMHGYELKGSNDTLQRVENQLRCYSRAYDFVTFVVTRKHLQKLLPLLPEWVGVRIAEPEGIGTYRAASQNPEQMRGAVVGLLRQAEVKTFLKQRGETGHSKKRDWELFDVLNEANHIPLAEVGAYVRQQLTVRLPARMKARESLRRAAANDRESRKGQKAWEADYKQRYLAGELPIRDW